jgi:excisionase family DNA binding protein
MPTDGHNDILSELPPVLTLEQAAEVLQIGVTTARGMCRQHQLPAFKVGAQWRIPRAWLIEFMRGDCHVR